VRKLEENVWKDSFLDGSTLITDGSGLMKTYDMNNGQILKVVKPIEDVSSMTQYRNYYDFLSELRKKIKLSRMYDIPSLVLPKNVYYDSNDEVKAYSVPRVNDESLHSHLTGIKDIELFDRVFSVLCDEVRLLNREGIILPDLGNTGNVLYNPKTGKVKFIDYDGMQVQWAESFSISQLLCQDDNDMLFDDKYRKNGLFNANLDKLSLLMLYVYHTTGKNIMSDINFFLQMNETMNSELSPSDKISPSSRLFDDFLEQTGLTGTELAELIYRSFDPTSTNRYPKDAIKKLTLSHRLVENEQGNRIFCRR
ncbi:MAG: hypothetical protein J6A52_05640, partial [Bacilli bacterium]|nr:hypothetical protein [Bacilli bacterium]